MKNKNSVVYVELSSSGHRKYHLDNFLSSKQKNDLVRVICDKELSQIALKYLEPENIIIFDEDIGPRRIKLKQLVKLISLLNSNKPYEKVHLAYLDSFILYLPILAIYISKISGLFFRPTMHYFKLNKKIDFYNIKLFFSGLVKEILISVSQFLNKNLSIKSLDNTWRKKSNNHLKDILPYSINNKQNSSQSSHTNCIFLFGEVSHRKGVDDMLHLCNDYNFKPLIWGKINNNNNNNVIEYTYSNQDKLSFTDNELIDELALNNHIVWLGYNEHVGSSAALLWAKYFNCKIIVRKNNYLYEQAKQFFLTEDDYKYDLQLMRPNDEVKLNNKNNVLDYTAFILNG